jgi:hypothetical protein
VPLTTIVGIGARSANASPIAAIIGALIEKVSSVNRPAV